MEYKLEVGQKEKGRIVYEELPIFEYLLRQMGFDVDIDSLNQKVHLSSALFGKKITFISEKNIPPHSFRKQHLERKVLKHIQKFLKASGLNVHFLSQGENHASTDLQVQFSLHEVPNISKPLIEVTRSSKLYYQKQIEILQSECKKRDIKFKLITDDKYFDRSKLKVQIMSPVMPDNEFWRQYGEDYAFIITFGILARFHGSTPLSLLSLVPVEKLLSLLEPNVHSEGTRNIIRDVEKEKGREDLTKTNVDRTKEVDVFFDYHVLIDEDENQKVRLLGNLHIKNTGTEPLRNPIICIRATPAENIKITGQILPQNFAQSKGVINHEGAKGWRYLNENWFEEFEEKGEIWICPIEAVDIQPRQTVTLSNLQIKHLDFEQKDIRVDAYVFFSNDGLEFKSNNQISLSLLKKVNSLDNSHRENK